MPARRIIDAHVHISSYQGSAKTLQDARDQLVSTMSKHGVVAAVVIPDNIIGEPHIADLTRARELIANRPNLLLLGSPLILTEDTLGPAGYEQLMREKVIRGLKFFPGHDAYYANDPRCYPYLKAADTAGCPVVFHTGENSRNTKLGQYNDPALIVKVARDFPTLKVVITHYCWPRMEYCYETTKGLPNIYFETAAMADPEVVETSGGPEIVKTILRRTIADNPDRVLFGTDWPMCRVEDHIRLIDSLGLDPETAERVFYGNAARLYGINS